MEGSNTEEMQATAIYNTDQYGHNNTITFIIDNYYVVTLELLTDRARWTYLQDAIREGGLPAL